MKILAACLQVVCIGADLHGGAGSASSAQHVMLLQVYLRRKQRCFQGFFGSIHAVSRWRLFLTVTLITALLIGWFQVVCFLHKFSPARVRPRLLRQYCE
jgi:hypothetical protein